MFAYIYLSINTCFRKCFENEVSFTITKLFRQHLLVKYSLQYVVIDREVNQI